MSNYMHLPLVMYYAEVIDPATVLDAGVGFGTYGFILRQFLDARGGKWDPAAWTRRIDGIEVFSPYRNPVWNYAYTRVDTVDLRTICKTASGYDLVLCNDVLEHLPKSDALSVVRDFLKQNRSLIITTPHGSYPQGAWGGNVAETHLCSLDQDDFPDAVVRARCGITTFFLLSGDNDIRTRVRRARRDQPRWAHTSLSTRLTRRIADKLLRVRA